MHCSANAGKDSAEGEGGPQKQAQIGRSSCGSRKL